jgi:hypothetical protein
MNANGFQALLSYNGSKYYFESMQMSVINRIETTPTVGGGSVRVRAYGSPETITLKRKIKLSDIFSYESLIKKLAAGVITSMTINGISYSGYTLASGKITAGEQRTSAVCEIILTEVEE